MPTLDSYRRILGIHGTSAGQARKSYSDMIMENTWDGDMQSKKCYIYDFYHDDEPEKNYKLSPSHSRSKTQIDAKYIVNSYNSDGKDQVSYHIQFRPSQECPLDYFYDEYERKYGNEFPIGLYIDIPDQKNVYRRWLIIENANTYDPQFITWSILPCDLRYNWIYKEKKYRMWGVSRSQSSLGSNLPRRVMFGNLHNELFSNCWEVHGKSWIISSQASYEEGSTVRWKHRRASA